MLSAHIGNHALFFVEKVKDVLIEVADHRDETAVAGSAQALLQVALYLGPRTGVRRRRVLTSVPQGLSLPKQVPSLVQRDLESIELRTLLVGVRWLAAQRVLLIDELGDLLVKVVIAHRFNLLTVGQAGS
jgi:hypothetical protein